MEEENYRLKHDPIEDSEEYKRVEKEVDELAEKEADKIVPQGWDGFCHVFWAVKKDILKKKYNIDWKSPAELNPDTMFD